MRDLVTNDHVVYRHTRNCQWKDPMALQNSEMRELEKHSKARGIKDKHAYKYLECVEIKLFRL